MASAIFLSLRLPHLTLPALPTPSSVTGAGRKGWSQGGPCHPRNMSYLSGGQQVPEGSFRTGRVGGCFCPGGAGALGRVPCALNSCPRAPPACSIQVGGRGDSCSPDLSTSAHAPLGRTSVPGGPGPPPTQQSCPLPLVTPALAAEVDNLRLGLWAPRTGAGRDLPWPGCRASRRGPAGRAPVPTQQLPRVLLCVMECSLLLGLELGQ